MRIKLHEYYNDREIAEIVEHMKCELGDDGVTEEEGVVTTNTPCALSASELFELAATWAKRKANDYHTKPEELTYDLEYGKILEKSAKEYFRDTLLFNDSMEFKHDDRHTEVVVKPTGAGHLISIGQRYGKACEQKEILTRGLKK